MTKIMIVDDEILVRLGLRSTISWDEHGFFVVADAANGEQAIEKFAAADPDILITDIRMPGMDGIELIRRLKERKPHLKTIILTNYDNFEYAKQALKLGADEYILKTSLDNQTLLPILKKLRDQIEREFKMSQEFKQLQQQVKFSLSYLKIHFAERLITGRVQTGEWRDLLKELGLKWEGHCFQVVLIKGRSPEGDISKATRQSSQLIEEIVEKINSSLVWESPSTLEWFIIYNFPPVEEQNYYRQTLPFNVRQVKSCLRQYFRMPTIAVFGKVCREYTEIPDQVQVLKKMLEYRFFLPKKELIFPEDINFEEPLCCPLGVEKNLATFIRNGDRNRVAQVLDEFFAKASQNRSPVILRQVCQELYAQISRLTREYGLRLTAILNAEEQNGNYLESLYTLEEIRDWFEGKFHLIMEQLQKAALKTYSAPIRQAIAYIEENYPQEINLLLLAQKVGLSKNHLCTLFHAETGENFVDYLHRVRIKHACELLETTDLKVTEVGLKVGYNDAKYFTKVFQKYHQCPPSEYRERC
ncbi:MAG: response regulator, partial [Bacillota bacterium]